jgi:hypothetical protein
MRFSRSTIASNAIQVAGGAVANLKNTVASRRKRTGMTWATLSERDC